MNSLTFHFLNPSQRPCVIRNCERTETSARTLTLTFVRSVLFHHWGDLLYGAPELVCIVSHWGGPVSSSLGWKGQNVTRKHYGWPRVVSVLLSAYSSIGVFCAWNSAASWPLTQVSWRCELFSSGLTFSGFLMLEVLFIRGQWSTTSCLPSSW